MRASKRCYELIKHFEQFRSVPYNDDAGHATVGYGHLIHRGPLDGRASEKPFEHGITEAQACDLLAADVRDRAECYVNQLVKVPLTQNQFDALVSFTFNVGPDVDADTIPEGLGDSTLLKKLNAGDYRGASSEFLKWNKAGGRVLGGLVRRRQSEMELFRETENA